jgi:hypothetical protein
MNRKPLLRTTMLVVASGVVLAASSGAFADDSSMSMWTGDSYAYFNNLDYNSGSFNTARTSRGTEQAPVAATPRRAPAEHRVMLASRPATGTVKSPFRDDTGA